MIDENNYQEWAMDYIEGTLGTEQRRAFDAFLHSHPAFAQQIAALKEEMPVLVPPQIIYPDKELLLTGRKIRLARRQERLQRLGAIASGAAAAAVLFGGLLFFHPEEGRKGTARIAAEAARDYPEGAAALAALQEAEHADTNIEAIAPAAAEATASVLPERQKAHAEPARRSAPKSTVRTASLAVATNHAREIIAIPDVPASRTAEQKELSAMPSRSEEQYATTDATAAVTLTQAAPVAVPAVIPAAKKTESQAAQGNPAANKNSSPARAEVQQNEPEEGELRSLLATLNDISPISIFRTTQEKGVTIASIIRISKKNDQ